MSGHSKWSTIKRAKGAADIKKGQTFTKVANAITLAAKLGGSGDPSSNPRLRDAVDEAKSVNMPKENIQRAIDKGLGKLPGQTIEEVLYEGFGPSKVAFLIMGATDNKLRTLIELKNIFDRAGGVLAGQGSVSYMFERKGEIKVVGHGSSVKSQEEEELELIDLGVEDIEPFDFAQGKDMQGYLVYTEATKLAEVGTKLTQAGYGVESYEVTLKPNILVEITDKESAQKVLEFANRLEDMDDVQKVYSNFDMVDELISNVKT